MQRKKRGTPQSSRSPSPMERCSALWPALSNNPECPLFAVPVELRLPAGSSGFGNTGCHSSVSTEMSSSSALWGEAWGQTPRPTDRQTAGSSGVEIAVTSHRKSLLTGMLHCSDTTKWAFTDPNTHREKSVGLTGGQGQDESWIRVCVDCTCKLCGIHVLKTAWKRMMLK